ncbi:MAG: urease accessory protein UreD [Paracoccaceae bacterium]
MTAHFPIPMQRAQGVAAVTLKAGGRLDRLRQQGSAKAILHHLSGPEVVFLNTSGGLTGGDRLSFSLTLADGVRAMATTQTAERAYRAGQGVARMDVALTVGAGGWLDWLPQETILFDGSALNRRTRVDLGCDAGCLILESVVLGRAAMGETVTTAHLSDRREVFRDGRPVLVDPVRLTDQALRSGPAGLDGARAFASVSMIAPGAADALAPVRRVLDEAGCRGAASALDGRLNIRILATDGWPLRRQVARVLHVLRPAGLPRVWQM